MKRIIAIILSLAMLLCAVSALAEESSGKVTIGTVTVNGAFTLQCGIPEGYHIAENEKDKLTEYYEGDDLTISFVSDDPNAPVMQLSIAYDEMYADVDRMNDLDDEALVVLEESFIENDPEVEISYSETGYGTLLLIARFTEEMQNAIVFFSIYKGYDVEFALKPSKTAESPTLTDEQIAVSIDFLTELDFIPGIARTFSAETVAEQKYIANLSDYDPETNTVSVEIMHSVVLPESYVESLKEGDQLVAGQIQEEISTIEQMEDGSFMINDEYELRKYGDEYHIYLYEIEHLEPYGTLKMTIPDNLTVLDNINKENGEPLDEPVTYTVDEFKAMLAAGEYPNFATDNTWVTFDENGEMVSVERVYSPAQ